MMAHASCLAMWVEPRPRVFAPSNHPSRYIANKKSPWRLEYAEMYTRAKERYEIYRPEGTKKQAEILQALREWIEQDFGGNTVVMPSTEFLQ